MFVGPRPAIPIRRYGSFGTGGTYICVPVHAIARFRNKRRFFVAIRSDSGCCDWWYYGTRYVGEAEGWDLVETRTLSGGQRAAMLTELCSDVCICSMAYKL